MLSAEEIAQLPEEERQLWENKRLVYDFFNRIQNERDLTATDEFLSPDYLQHNPNIVTGREGFKEYFQNFF